MTILASKNSQVLAFSPAIANLVGDTDAAVILQQIHYWIEKDTCGRVFDGARWIYKSYKQWQQDFRWRSIHQIRRCIGILRRFGLIKVEQWTKRSDDKNCYWYTVDYEALDSLLSGEMPTVTDHTTCAEKRTTPALDDKSSAESDTLSIYTKNTDQKIHPRENNSTAAAISFEEGVFNDESNEFTEELDIPTSSPSSQEKTEQPINGQIDHEDHNASLAACDNNQFVVLSDEEKEHS